MNDAPVFNTREVVDAFAELVSIAIAHEHEQHTGPDEPIAGLRKQFPGISSEQLRRTFAVFGEEARERERERVRESEQAEALAALLESIFEGLPDGTTLDEAAKIKAEQGDPVALSYLAHLDKKETRISSALFFAAIEAHPLWRQNDRDGRVTFSWLGAGDDAPDQSSMVDWFQLNHPAKAREIERAIEESDDAMRKVVGRILELIRAKTKKLNPSSDDIDLKSMFYQINREFPDLGPIGIRLAFDAAHAEIMEQPR